MTDEDATVRLHGAHAGCSLLPPRYRDPVRIARGGMSVVYRATDTELERTVAVKLLDDGRADAAELRRRFEREARAAARLSGEAHTVTIYDVGAWQERPFIVMEYLSGGSLEDIVRSGGAQPPARVIALAGRGCGRARSRAHPWRRPPGREAGEPPALRSSSSTTVALPVLVTEVSPSAVAIPKSATCTLACSSSYLAPEQAEGKPATAAADRYALGVVAFELLTGGRPFQRESVTAEVAAHVSAPVPSASDRGHGLPRSLDPVFAQALAKDPSARFGSCRDFVDALRTALDGADATTVIAPAPAAAGTATRRRAAAFALAALLLFGGGILAATLKSDHGTASAHATPPRTVTVTVTARAHATTSGTAQFANAAWQLADTLAGLGRCDKALPVVDRLQAIESNRRQFDQLRALCTSPPGHRPAHGHGHGHGHGDEHG